MPRRFAGLAVALVAAGCIDFAPPDPFNPENPFDRASGPFLFGRNGAAGVRAELEKSLSGATDDDAAIARLARVGIECRRAIHVRCTYETSLRVSMKLGPVNQFALTFLAEIEPGRQISKVVRLCVTRTIVNYKPGDHRPKTLTDCDPSLPARKTTP
jgi:hypothetical protein